MSTSPVPLSQINFNPLRQPGTPLALMFGGSVAGSLLSAMSGNPLAALVSEAIQNLQSSIDAINRVLNAAPVLQSLLLNSADIGVLNVASLYGPGQLGIYQGPPSFPIIGWAGSEAAPFQSPTTTITSTTTGTITTSSAHGLLVGQIVQILGTTNVAQNGFWVVATVPSGTTFTVTGFSGSSTGGTVQRVLVGGWFKTLAVGGTSYLNGITNGLFADENGNLTVNAATVKGTLSAATVLAGALNITIILVTGLVLTNNSPGAGQVAWSACTVYYQGTAYAISSGNTATTDMFIFWTVGNTTFTSAASYTPGPTIFAIATNNAGVGDITWNKVGSVSVQESMLTSGLLFGMAVQPPAGVDDTLTSSGTTNIVQITTASAPKGGGFLELGITVTTTVAGGGNGGVFLDITVDGQATQSITLYDSNASVYNADAKNVAGFFSGTGSTVGDNIHFSPGIGFKTALTVAVRVAGTGLAGGVLHATVLWAKKI